MEFSVSVFSIVPHFPNWVFSPLTARQADWSLGRVDVSTRLGPLLGQLPKGDLDLHHPVHGPPGHSISAPLVVIVAGNGRLADRRRNAGQVHLVCTIRT